MENWSIRLNIDKISVGKVFSSKNCGKFKVLEYTDSRNVLVEFLETKTRKTVSAGNIRRGAVGDMFAKTVAGVGCLGNASPKLNGSFVKGYWTWVAMLTRCYNKDYQSNYRSYSECYVSENFKDFEKFQLWCSRQIGFDQLDDKGKNFVLDKDILIKGNKKYSEDNCVFLPQELNGIILKSDSTRGKYPVGTYFNKERGKFLAGMRKHGKRVNIGRFDNFEDAFSAYKKAKEAYIKEVATKWKDKIDPRAYEALMNWEICIGD